VKITTLLTFPKTYRDAYFDISMCISLSGDRLFWIDSSEFINCFWIENKQMTKIFISSLLITPSFSAILMDAKDQLFVFDNVSRTLHSFVPPAHKKMETKNQQTKIQTEIQTQQQTQQQTTQSSEQTISLVEISNDFIIQLPKVVSSGSVCLAWSTLLSKNPSLNYSFRIDLYSLRLQSPTTNINDVISFKFARKISGSMIRFVRILLSSNNQKQIQQKTTNNNENEENDSISKSSNQISSKQRSVFLAILYTMREASNCINEQTFQQILKYSQERSTLSTQTQIHLSSLFEE